MIVTFAQPLWLLAGLAVCAGLIFLFRAAGRARCSQLAAFAAPHLIERLTASVSPAIRALKQTLWVLGVAFLFVAMSRPQWGYTWQEVHRRGIDIMIALDTSKSMLADDVSPNRLERAKLAVTDLAQQLRGDRIGLIAFAGDSFLQCPLTLDENAFLRSLQSLDTTIIPLGGSDLASAIREAEQALESQDHNAKILILITDGEDLGGNAVAAARDAAARGLQIFTVGVGSAEGTPIPVPNAAGGVEFVKDDNGAVVKSQLDEKTLQEIAEVSGGKYEPLGKRGEGLEKIYQEDLATMPERDLSSRQRQVPTERFQLALAAALACFILEMLLRDRRRDQAKRSKEGADIRPKHQIHMRPSRRISSAPAIPASLPAIATATFFALGLGFTPANAQMKAPAAQEPQPAEEESKPAAAEETRSLGEAQMAYEEGKFKEAAAIYGAAAQKDPEDPRIRFNLGASTFRDADFNTAEKAFGDTLAAEDVHLKSQGYYNLGNSLFRLGQKAREANPQGDAQETMRAWEKALNAYENAITEEERAAKEKAAPQESQSLGKLANWFNKEPEAPANLVEQSKLNYEFVRLKLEELKKQQQQQQDQQNQQQQDQQNQDQQKQDPQDQNQDQQQQPQSQDQQKQDQQENQNQQGQPQNQNGQNQKPEEQKSDPDKPGQDKAQDQGKPEKDQGPKPEQQKQPQPEQGNGDKKPQEQPKQGDIKTADGRQTKADDKQAAEPRQPGKMTRGEALSLLDAAKNEEEGRPATSYFYDGKPPEPDDKKVKDW
jgi:Ca-activated chloride channel family protein